MIRVISGKYKGKRLKHLPDCNVRPIPDKLKESLFDIIRFDVKGKMCLDGFAGTGSIGIEALSLGAKFVLFVDEYYPAVKVIWTNLKKCNAEDRANVIRKEFNRAVIQLAKERMKFDLIFLDPPYRLMEKRNPLKIIKKRSILKAKGMIVLRYYHKTKFETEYFNLKRKVTIGDDILAFYV